MDWHRVFASGIRGLFTRHYSDEEFDEELQTHLALLAEKFERQGMTSEDARYMARRQFGNTSLIKEVRNEMSTLLSIERLWQDLRYGVRRALSRRGATAVITLSLALGIGATTAVFTLIDAVMLKTLPVKSPEQLQLLSWTCGTSRPHLASNAGYKYHDKVSGVLCSSISFPFFEQLQNDRRVFSSVFGFAPLSSGPPNVNISVDGQNGVIAGEMVTGGYFSGLGVRPILGRAITDEDEKVDAPRVALISYRYWVGQLERSPAAIGKAITLNGIPFTIIGITPADFFGADSESATDIWVPADQQPGLTAWGIQPTTRRSLFIAEDRWWLITLGRLKPGITSQEASAFVGGLFRQNLMVKLNARPKPEDFPRLVLLPASRGLSALRQQLSGPLMMLMIIMCLVLLIACANVAILLLAQATARQREIGVRLALGASRVRLIRQLLTESVLLASMGGVLGLLLAMWSIRVLLLVLSGSGERVPRNVHPDATILGFTVAVSLLTGVLFGLAPSLNATGVNVTPLLKESADHGVAGRPRPNLRFGSVLVVAQVAMSLFLLVTAGLFVSTLRNVKNQDLGFDTHNLLLVTIDPTVLNYDRLHLARQYSELQQRLQAVPGVISATLSSLTLGSGAVNTAEISIEGSGMNRDRNPEIFWNGVGPKFFETLNIPLLLGRRFDSHDISSKVAVVNESMVRYFFDDTNPIGRRFSFSADRTDKFEIVGIVKSAKDSDLREEAPRTVYVPYTHMPGPLGPVHFEVRTAVNAAELIPSIRRLVHDLDPYLPILDVKTETEQINESVLQERFFAALSTFFGGFALLLACIGLHGTVAYAVNRRTHEIGIRLALGAQRSEILGMIARRTLLLLLMGLAIGLPCALGGARLVSSMLFGVKPTDPLTISIATLLIASIGMLAAYVPARRASRVDPIVALRIE